LFRPFDLVIFAAFKREKGEICVDQPAGSPVWQITKLMKVLEHVTGSGSNRAAFRRAGLIAHPRVLPPVALVDSTKLNEMIDASVLPDASEADGALDGRQMDPEARGFQSSDS
jgi:hypothetical protein